VTDEAPFPPLIYDGLEPVPEPRSNAATAIDALKQAVARANTAIEAGKRPGMPLSILSNVAREAPLGSLFMALLVGIAIGRRSR